MAQQVHYELEVMEIPGKMGFVIILMVELLAAEVAIMEEVVHRLEIVVAEEEEEVHLGQEL